MLSLWLRLCKLKLDKHLQGMHLLTATVYRIIQITDPHIRADSEATLMGFETRKGLDLVVAKISEDTTSPNAIVVTGDIAHDYSDSSYRTVAEAVLAFDCPVHWCPGNHDDKATMAVVAKDLKLGGDQIQLGNWVIQLLDSAVPGKVFGTFADTELAKARDLIASHPDTHLMFGFHHQPVQQGSRWLDELMIKNGKAFMDIVRDQPQVKGLFWGHVHQEEDQIQDGLRLLSTPSTCVQFAPKSDGFALDRTMPGYRWFDLYDDGHFETGVVRIDGIEMNVDFDGDGY